VQLKERDLLEETEVDSVEDLDSEVDLVEIETILEIKETQQLFLARMIRTPKKEPLELSQERKLLSDYSFKALSLPLVYF